MPPRCPRRVYIKKDGDTSKLPVKQIDSHDISVAWKSGRHSRPALNQDEIWNALYDDSGAQESRWKPARP